MKIERSEFPAILAGHAAARAFFEPCFDETMAHEEQLWVAHVDSTARCLHLGRYAGDGNARALAAIGDKVSTAMRAGRPDERLQQIQFLLERKEAALAQARRHIRMKAQLELWLYIHVPVTLALLAALLAHIISVFLYW